MAFKTLLITIVNYSFIDYSPRFLTSANPFSFFPTSPQRHFFETTVTLKLNRYFVFEPSCWKSSGDEPLMAPRLRALSVSAFEVGLVGENNREALSWLNNELWRGPPFPWALCTLTQAICPPSLGFRSSGNTRRLASEILIQRFESQQPSTGECGF